MNGLDGVDADDPIFLLLRDGDARRSAADRRRIAGAEAASSDRDGGPTDQEIAEALDLLVSRVEDARPADQALMTPGAWQAGLNEIARRLRTTPEVILSHLSGDGAKAWALLETILETGLKACGRGEWIETVTGDGRNGKPMTAEEAGLSVTYTAPATDGPDDITIQSRRPGTGQKWWQR